MNVTFHDLDDALGEDEAPRQRRASTNEDIINQTHIANGGGTADSPCPKCGGSGKWRGTWKVLTCNGCGGSGRVAAVKARGMEAAKKGQRTQAMNRAAWMAANRGNLDLFRSFPNSTFLQKLLADVDERGSLTQGQIDAGLRVVAKFAATAEERAKDRNKDKKAKSGKVDISRIEAMFERATSFVPSGRKEKLKRPILSTATITIKPAKRYEGVLYVTSNDGDVYLGKIAGGEFTARSEAGKDTLKQLRMICDDPEAAVKTYAEVNGRFEGGRLVEAPCGLCHRMMHDPESLARGIGPVCAARYGID